MDELRRKGLEKMNEVYAWEMPDVPGEFFALTVEHLFGRIWTRPGLSMRDRRMMLIGVLTTEQAYSAIGWRSVFLVAGMLPMGMALIKTNAAGIAADGPKSAQTGFLYDIFRVSPIPRDPAGQRKGVAEVWHHHGGKQRLNVVARHPGQSSRIGAPERARQPQ